MKKVGLLALVAGLALSLATDTVFARGHGGSHRSGSNHSKSVGHSARHTTTHHAKSTVSHKPSKSVAPVQQQNHGQFPVVANALTAEQLEKQKLDLLIKQKAEELAKLKATQQ